MNPNTELPQVHSSTIPATRHSPRIISTRVSLYDLPPSYTSIYASAAEDAVGTDNDGVQLLDNEDPKNFNDKTTRIGFIQKVLALKLLQMIGMTGIMVVFWILSWDLLRFMDRRNISIPLIVTPISVAIFFIIMLVCSVHKRPFKCTFLVAYPLTLGILISTWAIYWNHLTPILMACISYCIVLFTLIMYSIFVLHTKLQFNTTNGIIIAVHMHMTTFAVTVLAFNTNFNEIKFSYFIIFIIMIVEHIYVICDIQAMTSSTYWKKITPTDYVDGVINLHIDYYDIIHNLVAPKTSQDSSTITSRVGV